MFSGELFQPPSSSQQQSTQPNNNGDDRVHLPAAHVYDDAAIQQNASNHSSTNSISRRHQRRRLRNTRIAVLTCCLGIVVCAVLMVTKGVQSLVKSSDNAIGGIEKGQELADGAIALIDDFIAVSDSASETTNQFAQQINGFCPAVRDELCTNLNDADVPVECNFDGIPYDTEVEALLNAKDAVVATELYSTRDDMVELSQILADARAKAGAC